MIPCYQKLSSREWDERINNLYAILENCRLCPRECRVNRLKNETGFCRSGLDLIVSSMGPHFGEERPLVGSGGSGTIFLANCNLACVYCQNYDISHLGNGRKTITDDLANGMIHLQDIGCHNINLVTPTHFVPQLVKSIRTAFEKGLKIPIVYNCGGYESVNAINLLDGIVDIYMPDIKYGDNLYSMQLSNAPDYFEKCKEAVKEMHRQVGDLKTERGIAIKGIIIRHLVLPEGIAGSEEIIKFISGEISKESYVNIMGQYHPAYNAKNYDGLGRRPSLQEMDDVINMARRYGLHRGF